jgi:hypothetical protein
MVERRSGTSAGGRGQRTTGGVPVVARALRSEATDQPRFGKRTREPVTVVT